MTSSTLVSFRSHAAEALSPDELLNPAGRHVESLLDLEDARFECGRATPDRRISFVMFFEPVLHGLLEAVERSKHFGLAVANRFDQIILQRLEL